MNLPARLAWRYLFARKSTNAINIITFIATLGVSIGAAALLVALSVFNGYEDLFLEMFNNLNPDVRITAARGKTFEADADLIARIEGVEGVRVISQTLEETAGFRYGGRQSFGQIKGVDAAYPAINGIDSTMEEGEYDLDQVQSELFGAIVGKNMASDLLIDPYNSFNALSIYVSRPQPRGSSVLTTGRLPYSAREVFPAGVVRSQEAFENQSVLVPIALVRDLLGVDSAVVTAIEVGLYPGFDQDATYENIREAVGPELEVKNRYEQENTILTLMQIEKWVGYAIACLMMFLISFNLVGALWMIILEKEKDISILLGMGMQRGEIRGIFLRVGLLICGFGILTGFALAGLLALAQANYGLLSLPGTIAEAYPISFRALDFLMVAVTVMAIGLLASMLPARRAGRIEGIVRES